MDEILCKIICDTFPQVDSFNERMKRLGSTFFGIDFLDESSLEKILDPESLVSFFREKYREKAETIEKDEKKISSIREQLPFFCDSCFNEVIDFYRYNVSSIRTILLSIKDLIPFKLNKKRKAFSETIVRVTERILIYLDALDSMTQAEINSMHHIKTKKDYAFFDLKLITVKASATIHSLVGLNFLTMTCILLHQVVYEYFYGNVKIKKELLDLANQIMAGITVLFSPQLNDINRNMEQTAKTAEQTRKNTETTNNTLNEMKENQKETNKLIENRNEEEKPKRLQVAKCAKDICRILKNEYKTVVKQDTIEKYLHRFDDDLEIGNKIAIPSYEYAMYFDKDHFIVWIRETFIPHYLEHRKIRVKNKTPRRSSSDAAFDEAARQKYKDEEEGDDNY